MAKLVGVYHDECSDESTGKIRKSSCLARRQLPLTIEPGLTMIMALDDACLACGLSSSSSPPSSGSGSPTSCGNRLKNGVKDGAKGPAMVDKDRESFLRKYEALNKSDLPASFTVPFDDFLATLSNEVPCVGCRRSVESLLQKLYETCDSALEPLVITEDAAISVGDDHLNAPRSLANLFCVQSHRLETAYFGGQSGRKNHRRCPAHSLGLGLAGGGKKLGAGVEYWLDTWECMERECQEEVVLIHFDLLRQTLDRYLKKHSFCLECTNMVNKAYNLLVRDDHHHHHHHNNHEEEEEEEEKEEKKKSCCSASGTSPQQQQQPASGDCKNLYRGITACTADLHVHVECDPAFVSKLITMAEPELSGLRQERHAKTIEIAQKEVLTCIGICLYERFQRIQQRLREGQQSCDLLFLVALKSLRKSFDVAFESQQGISEMEKLCLELDEEERKMKEKAQKKRDKKSKKKMKEKEASSSSSSSNSSSSSGKKIDDGSCCKEEGGRSVGVVVRNRTRLPSNKELPSLESMLKVDDDDDDDFIPIEDIREFRARMPVVNRQREELRKNLRQRFNQLCINGL